MAQLVARLVRNEKVGGSNPPSSTIRTLICIQRLRAFVTDDIVVVRRVNGKQFLCPFSRPLGIRSNTAKRFKTRFSSQQMSRRFHTRYGFSYPVHINDLPYKKCQDLIEWKWTFMLNKDKYQKSVELGPRTLSLSFPDPIESLDWMTYTVQSWLETGKSDV